MAYEVINVHVAGEEPTRKKEEIRKDAASQHMTISAFMMWLYDTWKKRRTDKK